MTRYLQIKLALAVIGLIMLIWGIRANDTFVRWIGMGFLAASILMRFLPKRLRSAHYPDTRGTPPGT